MAAQIIPFSFDSHPVRTLLVNDQPWFVAADVADALTYRMASDMTRHLDADERGTHNMRTPSGDQEMLIINESGLYSSILRSRKAEAKRFKKWVTSEVLPAIRKQGCYVDESGKMSTLIGHTIGTDGFRCLGAVLEGKLHHLATPDRKRMKQHIWSQVHKAFSVVSAQDIPADKMEEARNFIAAYQVLEGELVNDSKTIPAGAVQDLDSVEYIQSWLRVAASRHAELQGLSLEVAQLSEHISEITNKLHKVTSNLYDPIREPITHLKRPVGYSGERVKNKVNHFLQMQNRIA